MADVVNLAQPPTDADAPVGDFAAALKKAGERGQIPRGKPQQPVFAPSAPMPGVVPEGAPTMAMDSAVGNSTNWAADQLLAAYYADGMSFLGYPLLAELAQRGEYRRLSEVIATEMTREWIELKSSSDEDKSLEINALEDEIKRLGVQDAFRRLAEQDGFFGRAHLYIDLGTTDTPDELKTPIGHGRDLISQAKIRKGGLKALRTVEAVWTYPIDYNASDPLRPDWYKPQSWFVMGKMIHATRLLTLVGREVPDLLKPAYMFGGLPLSQMAKTYIDKWTQTRDSVADLIRSFSTAVMLTDLTAMLNNGGQQIVQNRADLYNFFRDNRALLILNKETEEFQNISTPLAGLDALQAQSQEHICVSGNTLVETQRGQVRIDRLELTDQVMTRKGLAPLTWVGCTGYSAELLLIKSEHSAVWVTPCHPIYLPTIDAFVSAKNVRPGDLLLCSGAKASLELEAPTWPTSTGHRSSGAAIGGARLSRVITVTSKQADSCTDRSGLCITGRSLTATMSIISTKIQSIISSAISSASRTATIFANMSTRADSVSLRLDQLLPRFARAAALNIRPSGPSARSIAANVATPRLGRYASEPVYNLQVADGYLPELYANGILVHNCSISGLPLIKYTGLTPSGLNASSEGEIRSFYDWIAAYQELLFREPLTRVIDFIQLSRLGRVDPDITFDFKSLWQLDEAGKASVQATKADIHSKYEEMGAVTNQEVRRILATDPESPYVALDLDPEELPAEPPAPPMAGAGQPALGGPPRPPGGGPHQGAITSVTSPFGATRDPASGRQSLAAHRAGDIAFDQEAPVPLDPDLLEIARGAPSNIIQYIYGLQAERDRSRAPFDQAEWEESKHRREAHGRFTSGGGGGGVHQHIPSATPGVGARAAAAVVHRIGEVGRPEAQAIHEALKPGGEARKSWASRIAGMAKDLPKHIWHEEKTHAMHAAGGLKAMATGNRPTPEQMKGLRSFGLRMAMSGGSMLLTGDPTGTVAHAAVMLAQEIVQHVIIEHGAKLGIGMARAAAGGGDAAPDNDDLTPDDIARLQAFLEDLAEAIANYDPEAEAKKKAPLTGDAKWLADWFAEDAEFKEENVTRKHGQFARKGEGEAGAKKEEPAEKEEPEAEEPSEPEKKETPAKPEPAAAEPVKRAAPRVRTAETFASPNIRDLTFPQAQAELGGVRQKALGQVSRIIDDGLGLRETHRADVIGAWSDGAENSLMVALRGDPAMVRAAAAMKGAVSNQKAVLVFNPDPKGPESMVSFELPGDLSQIHDQLLQGGLAFHTLEPTPGGAKVHIYSSDPETDAAIERVAADVPIKVTHGNGEFIGTKLDTGTDEEQRADAQRAYEAVIRETEDSGAVGGRNLREVWRDADDHWREATWTQTGVEPPIGADPRERALSVRDILYGDTPAARPRSRTVVDIADQLMARGSAALRNLGVPGGRIQGPSPRTDHLLSRVIASEIKDAAARSGHAGNWYTSKVKEAMDVAALMHPELTTDPHARTAYTAALAITSQGEKVPSNVRLADQAYRTFKQTGRFPTNIEAQEKIAMNSNFGKYNNLLDTLGPEGTRQFLNTERTAGELTADGHPIQGENVDTPVYGSAIFGPKIGGGFFQNLNGNYNPVTMDLWFMRAWGRLAGSLKGQLDPASFAKTQGRFERALAAGGGPVPPTLEELKSQADAIVALHERDYAAHAAEYRAKTRLKSELTLSAERMIHAMDGINETPKSGGDRIWMRDVVDHARQMLSAEGTHLSNADLQAIWWYPEKELYAKLGGRDTEGTNVDYSTALQAEARKNGIPGEAIARAVGPVDR
jgi:hypothetical protein